MWTFDIYNKGIQLKMPQSMMYASIDGYTCSVMANLSNAGYAMETWLGQTVLDLMLAGF